eukprot:228689-Amphidinium_carterae.1
MKLPNPANIPENSQVQTEHSKSKTKQTGIFEFSEEWALLREFQAERTAKLFNRVFVTSFDPLHALAGSGQDRQFTTPGKAALDASLGSCKKSRPQTMVQDSRIAECMPL